MNRAASQDCEERVGTDGAAARIADGHRIVPGLRNLDTDKCEGGVGCAQEVAAIEAPLISRVGDAGDGHGEAYTGPLGDGLALRLLSNCRRTLSQARERGGEQNRQR